MPLADFYFHDPRLDLIPVEHLSPQGLTSAFRELLRGRGWADPHIALFNDAFALYWTRSTELAAQTSTWPPPRRRHVAVILDASAVRPYAQILNTSCWSLYRCDFDPATSSTELAAYLFVHGDRMAVTGEITLCALHNAPYWWARSEDEIDDFARGAARSTRPDASGFTATSTAITWMRRLHHEALRPAPVGTGCRSIPGSGLLVPKDIEPQPPALAARWTDIASGVVRDFHTRWHAPAAAATSALLDWLCGDQPPLLVSGKNERVLWDPDHALRVGALRAELRAGGEVAVRDIHADLQVAAAKTRLFHSSLSDPGALPRPGRDTLQSGYTYLHRDRACIAYNLHDPTYERLLGPALPYGRAMLAARTIHEWCHLAVDAGWVPPCVTPATLDDRIAAIAAQLDALLTDAPPPIRRHSDQDLALLRQTYPAARSSGAALTQLLLGRLSDYQGNLLATRFLNVVERETYVRHNIRTLRGLYRSSQVWRMLVRYVTEYQYLTFSLVSDPQTFLFQSTWFEQDLVATGLIDEPRFAALDRCVKKLCESYAVDASKIATPLPDGSFEAGG